MEKLWRFQEIAEAFGVSYSTLWRWAQRGQMQVVHLPSGTLRVKDGEVRRIVGERDEPVSVSEQELNLSG